MADISEILSDKQRSLAAIAAANDFNEKIIAAEESSPVPETYYDSSLLPHDKEIILAGIYCILLSAARSGNDGVFEFWRHIGLDCLSQYQDGVGPKAVGLGQQLMNSPTPKDEQGLTVDELEMKLKNDPVRRQRIQELAASILEDKERSALFELKARSERAVSKVMIRKILALAGVSYVFSPLSSSQISGIDYDDTKRLLAVKFRTGAIYEYRDVDRSVFESFLCAPSAGRFLSQHIKGVYSYEKIADATPRRPSTPKSSASIAKPESSGCLVFLVMPLLVGVGWALMRFFTLIAQ